mgnify:CR=1 FL=1|jgi:hypothetical protein
MKISALLALAAIVTCTTSSAHAQSKAVSADAANSVKHSAAIPRHLLHAGGHSLAGSVRLVSGVIAVPVWMSGGVSTGVGTSLKQSGKTAGRTATNLWDAATGDPAQRPALDRKIGLPKLKKPAGRPKDPSPADALKQTDSNR